MPYEVSGLCPQMLAVAPNLEHWRFIALETRSASRSRYLTIVNSRHIALPRMHFLALKRGKKSKRSGGLFWFYSISYPLSTCLHESSFQHKQRLVSRPKLNSISTFFRPHFERSKILRLEHARRKQSAPR